MQQSDSEKIPFWRDIRAIKIVGQVVVLSLTVALFFWLGSNLVSNLQRLNLTFGFNFLDRAASFGIADPPIDYSPTDPYFRALLVGLLNSFRVMFFGIIIATVLGITVGIGRLSDNWLVRKLTSIYVEVLRNTPLLLQLFFWYFAFFLRLPKIERPLIVGDRFFLTNRGLDIPWFVNDQQTVIAFLAIIGCVLLATAAWSKQNEAILRGRNSQLWLLLLGVSLISILLLFFFGLNWAIPQLQNQSITGGLNLSPEFATLLIGLGIYTSAFIAEVVRAGIQSVSQGQWEAARALGLKPANIMQLVIFPQALRVMIPPLTSEFLNLIKNSSLAIAIGYSDIYAIGNTIFNQT
ncbi:MAG: ABC transporter permease subunit, partial [Cyanobacteria bacterium P01_C01_bin.72]